MSASSHSTLLDVGYIVRRPHKIRVEVRRLRSGKLAVTLVSKSPKLLEAAALLRTYNIPHTTYTDSYGYTRVHVRGVDEAAARSVIRLARRALRAGGEELLVATT